MMTVAYFCVVIINILMIGLSLFKISRTAGKSNRIAAAIFMAGVAMLMIQDQSMPALMTAQLIIAISSSIFLIRRY